MTMIASVNEREAIHFDQLARQSGSSWWGHTTPAGQKRMQRRAAIFAKTVASRRSPFVLEIGCGTGVFTRAIADRARDVWLTACDISPASIDVARRNLGQRDNLSFHVSDVTRLGFGAAQFDVVTGNSILHHVPQQPCVLELFRVLKPGGQLLLFEPNLMNPELALWTNLPRKLVPGRLEFSDDEHAFTRWQGKRMLSHAGFVDVRVKPFDFLHPLTPRPLIRAVQCVQAIAEHTPMVREIGGSLILRARKPA